MTTKKKSAIEQIEELGGGPLTFGRMIESFRKCDEISQTELATKLKISRAHLCDIEKGRRQVSLMRAMQFAKALGYSQTQFAFQVLEDQAREVGFKIKITLDAA